MDKRLQKRHNRQVARARERVKLTEPDLRTEEEAKAAREASRPAGAARNSADPHYAGPSTRGRGASAAHSPAKADA